MTETIRVLQVLGGVNLGGAESRIMELYRAIDREKVQFDFLVHDDKEGFFAKEIAALGGRIYAVPRFRVCNYAAYLRLLGHFFAQHHEFRAVHGHMTSTASLYLPIAKKAGVPMTIAHARSAGVDKGPKGLLTKWMRKPLAAKADYCLACSRLAGEAVFGQKHVRAGKVKILPNAIEVQKYKYDAAMRESMREKLGLQEAYVIGHVGRFHYAKNHEFLIEIFAKIKQYKENAVLLLIGEGSLMPAVKEKAKSLGILQSVKFMGKQENTAGYYQAMDYLVFPSRFEGMPGTVIEAQAAGLPCLISENISEEVKVTELVQFASLAETPKAWAKRVCAPKRRGVPEKVREDRVGELTRAGFAVQTQAKWYEHFYTTGVM